VHHLTIRTEFAAAHAIVMRGEREALHGHNWRVTATIEGERLDEDGLLVDFHLVESSLRDICGRLHNGNLNEIEPFDRVNPTAEHVAMHIAERLAAVVRERCPGGVRVRRVGVTEAPGCEAVYEPPREGNGMEGL
jgi:6-pyruvoyltetrahydropterin/6-carboxytetrahydropterin synthase